MQLSLNNVFKKPRVKGSCAYRRDCPEEPDSAPGEALESEAGPNNDHTASGDRVPWLDEKEFSRAGAESADKLMPDALPAADGGRRIPVNPGPTPEQAEQRLLEQKAEQGLREGYEKGLARAEEECRLMREEAESGLREAERTLNEARLRSKEIVSSSENKIVELAMAVAERLVRTRLELAPDTINSIVRSTMNMLHDGEQVEIFVNPADLEACLGYREQLKEEFHRVLKIEVTPDDSIPRGSCRIESECGAAEYMLEEEKEQLKSTLLNIARRAGEQPPGGEEEQRYDRH